MYAGTTLTVGGTVLAIAFSSKKAATLTSVRDLLDLWTNPAWIGYICAVSNHQQRRGGGRWRPPGLGAAPPLSERCALAARRAAAVITAAAAFGAFFCLGQVGGLGCVTHFGYKAFETAEREKRPYKHSKNVMAVLYSTFSALFGSSSVVFAKLLAEFLELAAKGVPIFSHW